MKKINVTFSLPVNTKNALHALIPPRKISAFVAQALEKALNEQREKLEVEYELAANDPGQREAQSDWAALECEAWEQS